MPKHHSSGRFTSSLSNSISYRIDYSIGNISAPYTFLLKIFKLFMYDLPVVFLYALLPSFTLRNLCKKLLIKSFRIIICHTADIIRNHKNTQIQAFPLIFSP